MILYIYLTCFRNTFTVDCNIDKVWDFYTDLAHLKYITPNKIQLKIIDTNNPLLAEGQEFFIEGKIGLIKRQWHSKITFLKKYEYIDEMLFGPFKKWTHSHLFEKINENKTRITDNIDFLLPYGLVGKIFTPFALYQLKKIFEHRKNQTIRILSISHKH